MEFTRQVAEQLLITSVERLVDFDEQLFFLELGDRGTDDGLCRCRHFVFYFGNGFERVRLDNVNPILVNHHALEIEFDVNRTVMEANVMIRLLRIDRDEVAATISERFPVKAVRCHHEASRGDGRVRHKMDVAEFLWMPEPIIDNPFGLSLTQRMMSEESL